MRDSANQLSEFLVHLGTSAVSVSRPPAPAELNPLFHSDGARSDLRLKPGSATYYARLSFWPVIKTLASDKEREERGS